MKYIDADKLEAKIQKEYLNAKKKARYAADSGTSSDYSKREAIVSEYEYIMRIIASLQREQAELDEKEWSEEDEIQMQGIIDLLPGLSNRHNWLQSLKERVQSQPKYEWSEEDEKISNAIYESIDFLCLNTFGFSEDEVCDWLKSLRPQPHWKPTNGQMEALQIVIEHGVACPNREASLAEKHLEELYNDLIKLLEQ